MKANIFLFMDFNVFMRKIVTFQLFSLAGVVVYFCTRQHFSGHILGYFVLKRWGCGYINSHVVIGGRTEVEFGQL